eukprot:scaffold162879_cov17-Tisochrysis_lutea.AAC.2
MVTMVTMGSDLQPGRLADRLADTCPPRPILCCRAIISYLQVVCEQHRLVERHLSRFTHPDTGADDADAEPDFDSSSSAAKGLSVEQRISEAANTGILDFKGCASSDALDAAHQDLHAVYVADVRSSSTIAHRSFLGCYFNQAIGRNNLVYMLQACMDDCLEDHGCIVRAHWSKWCACVCSSDRGLRLGKVLLGNWRVKPVKLGGKDNCYNLCYSSRMVRQHLQG